MKKASVLLFSILLFISCQKNKTSEQQTEVTKIESTPKIDTTTSVVTSVDSSEIAKKWLIYTIEDSFKNDMVEYDKFCTKKYAEYKSDATGIDMDGGMDENAFIKKWKKEYDTKYSGMGVGFMISGQDWFTIKVTNCTLKNKTIHGDYIFQTIVEDIGPKVKYNRDIKVIRSGKSFLIDDVLEYN
jgi:hypothetical protein